jgi:hypothetical protein
MGWAGAWGDSWGASWGDGSPTIRAAGQTGATGEAVCLVRRSAVDQTALFIAAMRSRQIAAEAPATEAVPVAVFAVGASVASGAATVRCVVAVTAAGGSEPVGSATGAVLACARAAGRSGATAPHVLCRRLRPLNAQLRTSTIGHGNARSIHHEEDELLCLLAAAMNAGSHARPPALRRARPTPKGPHACLR